MRLSILTLAVLLVLSGQLFACSCVSPPPPKQALAKAHAVFSGKVTYVKSFGGLNGHKLVTIEIATTWKGTGKKKQVVVRTAGNSAMCGFAFQKDKSYLLYCYTRDGQLQTNICTRTKSLVSAAADLKELGEGMKVSRTGG